MKYSFHIDKKVLGIFLKIDEEALTDKSYDQYLERLVFVVKACLESFARERGILEGRLNVLLEKFDKSTEKSGEQEDTELKELMSDDKFISKVQEVVNALNKHIYSTYLKNLNEEEKNDLKEHLEGISELAQSNLSFYQDLGDFYSALPDSQASPATAGGTPAQAGIGPGVNLTGVM